MEKFGLSRIQAQAILDLRLQRLTAMEADKIQAEHDDVLERIKELREILGDEQRVRDLIKEELIEIKDAYGNPRRTEITHSEDDIDIEDLIADQQMVIAITALGLHQAAAAGHLPQAEARRRRRDRHGHEGRRLHRAPLRVLDARLPPVLHQPRQGLPPEGLRAARGRPDGARARAGQRAAAARGRAGAVRAVHARLHRGQVPGVRHPPGPDQEDRVPGLQHADQGRRHHRHQDPRRRRAGGRPPHRRRGRHHHDRPLGPGGPLQRRPRRGRWAATRPA